MQEDYFVVEDKDIKEIRNKLEILNNLIFDMKKKQEEDNKKLLEELKKLSDNISEKNAIRDVNLAIRSHKTMPFISDRMLQYLKNT